jgi:predicted transcriptional regulator
MDATVQKIITFLTRNAHLDCEIPDIAFHLKLDEQQVQQTLNELYEKGVVTLRQNQYGRTYWYFVPQRSSMPFETMSSPVSEELTELDNVTGAGMSGTKKIALTALVLSLVAIVVISGILFLGVWMERSTIKPIEKELQSVVKQEEFTNLVDAVEKRLTKIENELKKTIVSVDSLKSVVRKLESR